MNRVLCVEDERAFREDVADFLRLHDFEVDEAASGAEALEQIHQQHYDLVLCDIKMPGLSGFDVLNTLRHADGTGKSLPFMFLTAQNDKDYQMRAHRYGCDVFLTKPVDLDVLVSAVEARIERQQTLEHALSKAQHHFHELMAEGLTQELLQPMKNLTRITSYAVKIARGNVPQEISSYLEAIDQILTRQVGGLTTALDALRLQHRADPVEKSIVAVENVFANVAPEHTICEARFIMADGGHLSRALSEFLASGIVAEPEKKWVALEEDGREARITVADSPLPLTDSRAPRVRFDEKADLAPYLPLLTERLVPLLYADAVARHHGGHLSLSKNSNYLAVTLHLPKDVVH
jgi:DNA-binding response OmpR family regulator